MMRHADAGSPASPETLVVRAWFAAALVIAVLAVLTVALPILDRQPLERLTQLLAYRDDLFVAPVLAGFLMLSARHLGSGTSTTRQFNTVSVVSLAFLFLLLVGWVGHYLTFQGYDLSRDEQMANFDANIFRHGRLFQPIPIVWRQFADALNLRFILPIGAREGWVSAYLPVHAAYRAALGVMADQELASPLMAAVGVVALWRISRILWPDSASTQIACILLYAGSSQIVVTSMTAFSMSMHLALNMVWLWLFLIDRPRSHAAAMGVGWLATGIHQPLFHPLFVLPFLIMIAKQRRWTLLCHYLLAYALIGAFWLAWPIWVSSHGAAAPQAIAETAGVGFLERLQNVVTSSKIYDPWMMVPNLLRFICWQHPLLLPLVFIGVWANWRENALCQALSIGIVLPIIVLGILLPWQGHGWGYRYLHPVLGNAVLLAGSGWRALEARRSTPDRAFIAASAIAMLLLLPWHAMVARSVASPFVRVHRQLNSINADFVIVDTEAVPFGQDVVFNSPSFNNHPKLMIAWFLDSRDVRTLCKMGSLAFVPGSSLGELGAVWGEPAPPVTHEFSVIFSSAAASHCDVKQLYTRRAEMLERGH